MKIKELLNFHYEKFSENEKYICHYLTQHYWECSRKSLEEFAKDCNVSKTLLVRFAKKLGLCGYSELKANLKLELKESKISSSGLMDNVTNNYHKMMNELMKKDLMSLFDKLYMAERVFIYGSGSSQTRAASEMKRMFLPAKEMINLHGHDMCEALGKIATYKDIVIVISLSGESDTVIELAKILRIKNVPVVSITKLKSNTLASLCKENLYINSIQIPVGCDMEYEVVTPYFILIEFLYLSYQNYLQKRKLND